MTPRLKDSFCRSRGRCAITKIGGRFSGPSNHMNQKKVVSFSWVDLPVWHVWRGKGVLPQDVFCVHLTDGHRSVTPNPYSKENTTTWPYRMVQGYPLPPQLGRCVIVTLSIWLSKTSFFHFTEECSTFPWHWLWNTSTESSVNRWWSPK